MRAPRGPRRGGGRRVGRAGRLLGPSAGVRWCYKRSRLAQLPKDCAGTQPGSASCLGWLSQCPLTSDDACGKGDGTREIASAFDQSMITWPAPSYLPCCRPSPKHEAAFPSSEAHAKGWRVGDPLHVVNQRFPLPPRLPDLDGCHICFEALLFPRASKNPWVEPFR